MTLRQSVGVAAVATAALTTMAVTTAQTGVPGYLTLLVVAWVGAAIMQREAIGGYLWMLTQPPLWERYHLSGVPHRTAAARLARIGIPPATVARWYAAGHSMDQIGRYAAQLRNADPAQVPFVAQLLVNTLETARFEDYLPEFLALPERKRADALQYVCLAIGPAAALLALTWSMPYTLGSKARLLDPARAFQGSRRGRSGDYLPDLLWLWNHRAVTEALADDPTPCPDRDAAVIADRLGQWLHHIDTCPACARVADRAKHVARGITAFAGVPHALLWHRAGYTAREARELSPTTDDAEAVLTAQIALGATAAPLTKEAVR